MPRKSADAGGSAHAGDSADAEDSAHAGDSADPWALSVLDYVVHLAQSSLPTVDSVLGINASMMLNPHLIQEGEKLDCVCL